jgi:hypothetical protein
MGTLSVTMVASRTHHDPFLWPTLLDLPNLRLILGKGNRQPTPGPDGWENGSYVLSVTTPFRIS